MGISIEATGPYGAGLLIVFAYNNVNQMVAFPDTAC